MKECPFKAGDKVKHKTGIVLTVKKVLSSKSGWYLTYEEVNNVSHYKNNILLVNRKSRIERLEL